MVNTAWFWFGSNRLRIDFFVHARKETQLRSSNRFPIFVEWNQMEPNFDYNYTSPIDLATNKNPFGAKSIDYVKLQSKFGFVQQNAELNFSVLEINSMTEISMNWYVALQN